MDIVLVQRKLPGVTRACDSLSIVSNNHVEQSRPANKGRRNPSIAEPTHAFKHALLCGWNKPEFYV